MAKARKFTSLKAAHDWLAKRGFAQTAMQHVWQNGKVTAWISIQLGSARPTFIVSEEMAPLVHMNGSSEQDLIDQQIAIMDAADALLAALRAASPNGRDYYPLGDDALVRAAAEHKARVVQAEALRAEAEALALAIQAQGRGR